MFINGCHTTNLTPDEILTFVTGFSYARASGVMGTEVSVKVPIARVGPIQPVVATEPPTRARASAPFIGWLSRRNVRAKLLASYDDAIGAGSIVHPPPKAGARWPSTTA